MLHDPGTVLLRDETPEMHASFMAAGPDNATVAFAQRIEGPFPNAPLGELYKGVILNITFVNT